MPRQDRRHNQGRRRRYGSRDQARSSYDEARDRDARLRRGGHGGLPIPGLLLVLFAVLACRLVWLQVIDGPNLAAKAEQVHTGTVTVSARRGTIYDRNGNVLASSVECRTLYCNPKAVDADKRHDVANLLASQLGGDASTYMDVLSQDTTFAYLKKKADTDAATQVLSDLSSMKVDGIYSVADTKRVYPYGATGGQVLGFIGADGHGLSGLELQYDDVLSGTDGEVVMERGLDGTPVAGGAAQISEAKDGEDIIVSLDVSIQQVAEEQLTQAVGDSEAETGNVVVTDPGTGEILAAASTPLSDPTDPSTLTNEALKLASVSDSYEPGSTFKILTMAIGYDTGTINGSSTFTVPAKVKVGDDYVTDDDGRDYPMDMTPYEIMRRSSNTGAAMVGQAIGADKLASGLERCGIGSATGIDSPGEVSGLVTRREDYTGATVGSTAFGQGIAFPSIQLVRAVGAVANKGVLTTPHFLVQQGGKTVDWGEGSRAVSEEAAAAVTRDMEGVVTSGTGRNAQVKGYSVAGKTGTGEQASSEGGYAKDLFLSSFIGFANADDAKALVYVGIYGTSQHGATAAAPYFSAIMGEALADLGVKAE